MADRVLKRLRHPLREIVVEHTDLLELGAAGPAILAILRRGPTAAAQLDPRRLSAALAVRGVPM
jgi:hypothetical protein